MEFASSPLYRRNRLDLTALITPTKLLAGVVMLNYVLVAFGSAIGGILRYWASGAVANRIGPSFPWDTLFVNATGSFIIGFIAALTAPEGQWLVSPHARSFIMIGLCGGYTTFSTFSLQTLALAQDKEWLYAGGNAILSVVLCLVSVWLGHAFAENVNPVGGGR
jgi:CrcB protein